MLQFDTMGKDKEDPKRPNIEEEETILLAPTTKRVPANPLTLKMQGLEDSLRSLHSHDTFGLTSYDELCFFPDYLRPAKFKMPDF